ncbi:hypothetical protein D5086_002033 [Populus alba]|uniref:Uncharacterized protein n=1 Tax=Populus alba TaxID=43335 RepID=A0ACC4D1M1_POPAL
MSARRVLLLFIVSTGKRFLVALASDYMIHEDDSPRILVSSPTKRTDRQYVTVAIALSKGITYGTSSAHVNMGWIPNRDKDSFLWCSTPTY